MIIFVGNNSLFIMKGTEKELLKILDGADKRLFIPVYQRNYDWKRDNCELLFNDLTKLIRTNKKSHFFGSIVTAHVSGGGSDDFIIIDGQQRITTVTILFMAMINAVKNGDAKIDNQRLCEKIMDSYIVDEYSNDEKKIRLKPTKGDAEAFNRIIEGDEEKFILDSNITNNYYIFYDSIKNMTYSVDQLYEAIRKLCIIDIFVESDDDPQLIFESLNSTGLKLTEADMIRNFVLMGLEVKEQNEYYNNYWIEIEKNTNRTKTASFFRDYLTVKQGKIPAINDVYFVFKKYAEEKDIQPILKDLLKYSRIYSKILTCNSSCHDIDVILKRLNTLDMTVSYPFLLALFDYAQEINMEEQDLIIILSCIETYILRRLMCGMPTNALNKIFCTLHKDVLRLKRNSDSYSSVVIYILENKTSSSSFPKDEKFKNAFITKDIYSMQKKNKLYLFERLENGNSKETSDIVSRMNDGTYTIEHIMPQTLNDDWKRDLGEDWQRIHEEWQDTIANLTLTGYNSKYQNKCFKEKKLAEHGFADSSLRLNKYLRECDKWTEEEMKNRQKIMVDYAMTLWPYPNTDYVPEINPENIHSLYEDFDYTNYSIRSYTLMGTSYKVLDWTDTVIGVIKSLYDLDKDSVENAAASNDNVSISNAILSYGKSVKIADYVYINKNTNTNNKIKLLKYLFSECDLDQNELQFNIYLKNENNDDLFA
jgi:uncharacterized protein with ParB-like and HNH nuclease domain